MSFNLEISPNINKYAALTEVAEFLGKLSLDVTATDFERPWGGFFVIDEDAAPDFIANFFPDYNYDQISEGFALTPKILVVEPGKRLSWQYHHRRAEIWSVVAGPVGIITSDTDEQGEVQTLQVGEVAEHLTAVRHRLVGLDGYGVVAEFWKHTDPSNPSDESDIVRVADDFAR